MTKPKIRYVHSDKSGLDDIKLLWQALNNFNLNNSVNFKEHYLSMTFEKRKADLLKKATFGEMRVDMAIDEFAQMVVGYIVSTVNSENTGEIESVFVSEAYRGQGIGDKLMKNTLEWMEQKGAVAKIVEVSVGNEQAWNFYSKYGFLPRKMVLNQIKKK